jgi:hypothetical protein
MRTGYWVDKMLELIDTVVLMNGDDKVGWKGINIM